MSKLNKRFLLLVIIVLVLTMGFYAYKWVGIKKQKISIGLAEPNFPFRDYTVEELGKMHPQIKNVDVPTRITPEETYANFRQALNDNNLNQAVNLLSKDTENYDDNVKELTDYYNKKEFHDLYNFYPEQITKANMYEAIAQYYYLMQKDGYNVRQYINFDKDVNGDWKMSSL